MLRRNSISDPSSLSSISEDSTFGVEREDLPTNVPKRRRSLGGSRSLSATGEVKHRENVETFKSIHEEKAGAATRPKRSSKKSSSKRKNHHHISSRRTDSYHRRTEESKDEDERSTHSRRSRRSSASDSSRRRLLSHESSSKSTSDASARSPQPKRSNTTFSRASSVGSAPSESNGASRRSSRSSGRSSSSSSSSLSARANPTREEAQLEEKEANERGYISTRRSSSSSSRRHNEDRHSRVPNGEELPDEASEDESRPGAYRISSFSRSSRLPAGSLPSSSGHTLVAENSMEEHSASSFSALSSLTPASIASTMVTAEVARDMTDEIEAAREQGRAEGLRNAANRNNRVVVAVPRSRRSKKGEQTSIRRRKDILFFLLFCVIVMISVGGYVLTRKNKQKDQQSEATKVPDNNSAVEAVISFDPPTGEDCSSIANGTAVAGQEEMFTQFVDMHVQITSEREQDASLLVRLLKQQIQLNLLPRLIGCDTLIGNVIGNGVVESVNNETSACLFKDNPNCSEVVLTVKIYLRRQEDGSAVLEIITDILLNEDLNETLDLPPTVQTAGVSQIVLSEVSSSVPSETPSSSPSGATTESITLGTPSTMPTAVVQTVPTLASPSLEEVPSQVPTFFAPHSSNEPTRMEGPLPIRSSSAAPTFSAGHDIQFDAEAEVPSGRSSVPPSASPSQFPSTAPTESPSEAPSDQPSSRPTNVPSKRPTLVPSVSPTTTPSVQPTTSPAPSSSPSSKPSGLPSVSPSRLPSATPSGLSSVTSFYWVACGKVGSCSGDPATVQNANDEFVGGVPSAQNEDMIAVRCCSDTRLRRFHEPKEEGCPFVRSEINDVCHNTATYWEAETICSSVGARLCTLEEVQNNCTKSSGCGHNKRMAWTSTPGLPP